MTRSFAERSRLATPTDQELAIQFLVDTILLALPRRHGFIELYVGSPWLSVTDRRSPWQTRSQCQVAISSWGANCGIAIVIWRGPTDREIGKSAFAILLRGGARWPMPAH
jgi:hypothetical protein